MIAGPGTGKYLADFGAEVIKVEAPGGDPDPPHGLDGAGRNRFIFLEARQPQQGGRSPSTSRPTEGKAELWPLLAEADVLIENMRPGKLEALGFGAGWHC